MADDVSTGELDRRLGAHEERSERAHEALGSRITDLAAHTVPLGEWQRAERVRDEERARLEREHNEDLTELKDNVIKPLVGRVERLEKRPGVAWGWIIAGGTFVVTVLAVLIQAWSAAKGAK